MQKKILTCENPKREINNFTYFFFGIELYKIYIFPYETEAHKAQFKIKGAHYTITGTLWSNFSSPPHDIFKSRLKRYKDLKIRRRQGNFIHYIVIAGKQPYQRSNPWRIKEENEITKIEVRVHWNPNNPLWLYDVLMDFSFF